MEKTEEQEVEALFGRISMELPEAVGIPEIQLSDEQIEAYHEHLMALEKCRVMADLSSLVIRRVA